MITDVAEGAVRTVIVVGAGPAGCATALALARSGTKVHLLEAGGTVTSRLAGELIHPRGVRTLTSLGIDLTAVDHSPCYGFAFCPPDKSPVLARYPTGDGITVHHRALVSAVRAAASAHSNVTMSVQCKVTGVGEGAVSFHDGRLGRDRRITADQIIGAEGSASMIRTASRPEPSPVGWAHSRMVGLMLHDAVLPAEGYGHVLSGGPGPVLAYRVDRHRVRLMIDIPLQHPRAGELLPYLFGEYLPVLPAAWRDQTRAILDRGEFQWSTNRYRRRSWYGAEPYALVGDAVGMCHPITAVGMTLAFADAEDLASSPDVAAYRARRASSGWVHERLAAALHRTFSGQDTATCLLRDSLYEVAKTNRRGRDHMMRLLSAEASSKSSLAVAVLRVALRSLRLHPAGPRTVKDLLGWLRWMYLLPTPASDTAAPTTTARDRDRS